MCKPTVKICVSSTVSSVVKRIIQLKFSKNCVFSPQ